MKEKTLIKRNKEIKVRLTEAEHQALLERMEGGVNNNIGKEGPIVIVEHQQKIAVKLKEVISQYKQKITSTSLSNNW